MLPVTTAPLVSALHRKRPPLSFPWGGGGTPYNALYGEAPPKKGYYFHASGIWKGTGISLVEVYERVWKSFSKRPKRANGCILWLWESRENDLVKTCNLFIHSQYIHSTFTGQLKGMQSSNLETWKGWHWSIKSIQKRYLFSQKWYIKGWGVGHRGGPPRKKICWATSPGCTPLSLSLTLSVPPSLSRRHFLIPFVVSLQNWLAFESIHRPIFSEHNDVNFQIRNVPSKSKNFAFCKVCNKSLPEAGLTGISLGKTRRKILFFKTIRGDSSD